MTKVEEVERRSLISQALIGVFCDNTENHPLADLGRVEISFFSGSNIIVKDRKADDLQLLTEYHIEQNSACANSISYVGRGNPPIHFILPG